LATVYGIVKQHQGWITVNSAVGQGTAFQIYFPALIETAKPDQPLLTSPSSTGGQETILVVEDEPALRTMVKNVLKRYGYRILDAENGPKAIQIWEKEQGKIDLLLTDMVMPEGMTGHELALELRKRKPSLKVIYTSGYSLALAELQLPFDKSMAFLSKPFQAPLLIKTIRECLDSDA
jgi:CheY-like chemotaxis protein